METEIWKPVIGYEGLYEISNLGRVKSLGKGNSRNSKVRILKQSVYDKYGHSRIFLFKEGIDRGHITPRLVGLHFIPNPDNLPCVLHKKEDLDENGMLNNGEDNLYWGTHKDNMQDMIKKGRGSQGIIKYGSDSPSSKKVLQYTLELEFIREWECMSYIEKELGIGVSNISSCCTGRYKSAKGFIWKFK